MANMGHFSQTVELELPTEIPDSQEAIHPYLSDADSESVSNASDTSSVSVLTDLIPGGTRLSTRGELFRYPLHLDYFNSNGCIPSEAPAADQDDNMEDEPTQRATQPFFDPRRQATKSSRERQDEADVLCILTPCSRRAHDAVDLVAEMAPQHILQNHLLEGIPEVAYGEKRQDEAGAFSESCTRPAKDIALRMSSRVHDPCKGFVFGRHSNFCDILLSKSLKSDVTISNIHFRIFMNRHGVLMIEDMSRNGTKVDNVLLRSAKSDAVQPTPSMNTVTGGTTITVPPHAQQSKLGEEEIRFTVRMPSRDHEQAKYTLRLEAYVEYTRQAERRAAVANHAGRRLPPLLPMPFNPISNEKKEPSPSTSLLGAATGEYNHGMRWNGGSKYNVVSYIGKGAFAMVYKLSAVSNGEVYAAKEIENRRFVKNNRQGNKLQSEIQIMKSLDHPHIVKFVEFAETQLHTYIIMEFVPHGDLTAYTKPDRTVQMPEFMAQKMAGQIGSALKYLHEKGITHRDIKPDNILVAKHEPSLFKLSDFGLSKMVENDETIMKTFCGTILYCAPEIYPAYQRMIAGMRVPPMGRQTRSHDQTQPYQHSVDTWGIAAVLYHLLTGVPAWSGTTDDQGNAMLANILHNPVNWQRLTWCGVSPICIEFLQRMLVIDPSERPTDDQILCHPFITSNPEIHTSDDLQQLDASQLSLNDHGSPGQDEDDDLGDYQEVNNNDDLEYDDDSQPSVMDGTKGPIPGYPQVPDVGGRASQHPRRLFGEIPGSALKSSGVLGQNAYAALQVQEPINGGLNGPFVDPSAKVPRADAISESHDPAYHQTTQHNDDNWRLTPSVLGAEAQLRQIVISTPKTATVTCPAHDPSEGEAQHMHLSMVKRKTDLQAELGEVSQSKRLRSSHGPTRGDFSYTSSTGGDVTQGAKKSVSGRELLIDKDQSQHGDHQDAQLSRGLVDGSKSLVATAFNSQTTDDVDLLEAEQAKQLESSLPNAPDDLLQPPGYLNHPNTTHDQNGNWLLGSHLTAPEGPSLYFGELIPVGGSIQEAPTIIIDNRSNTTFGRAPDAKFHLDYDRSKPLPDHLKHCPRYAIDIVMWYPKMEEDILKDPAAKWYQHPELEAVLHTRTDLYIKVNGVKLTRGDEKHNRWGCLRTGDLITVFDVRKKGAHEKGAEDSSLIYRCRFTTGACAEPRPADQSDPFTVKTSYSKAASAERAQRNKAMAAKHEAVMDVDIKDAEVTHHGSTSSQNKRASHNSKDVASGPRPSSSSKAKGKAATHAKSAAKGKSFA